MHPCVHTVLTLYMCRSVNIKLVEIHLHLHTQTNMWYLIDAFNCVPMALVAVIRAALYLKIHFPAYTVEHLET